MDFNKLIQKQKMMETVIRSLIPIIIASIYFYGWRTLAVQVIVMIAAFIMEYFFVRNNNKAVTQAVFVTAILYTLTLPPSIPYWIAVIGIVFGVLFGKMAFGGFAKNVFNPALVGRAFIYVCFPNFMTINWISASKDFPGGFTKWINPAVEVVTSATPLIKYRSESVVTDIGNLIFGSVSGVMGETSKILIILGAIYLIRKKVASWEIMTACIAGFVFTNIIIGLFSNTQFISPINAIASGGFLFGTVFMATDPISSASTKQGKWIYGVIIGIITFIIRNFSLFAEGMMFAILIANTFAPLIDEIVKSYNDKKKEVIING